MKAIPNRTFLLRQDELEGGKKKDVIAKEGVQMEITEKEAVTFFGSFNFTDVEKKKVVQVAKARNFLRMV